MVFQIPAWIVWMLVGIGAFSILSLIFGQSQPPIDYSMLFLLSILMIILVLLIK